MARLNGHSFQDQRYIVASSAHPLTVCPSSCCRRGQVWLQPAAPQAGDCGPGARELILACLLQWLRRLSPLCARQLLKAQLRPCRAAGSLRPAAADCFSFLLSHRVLQAYVVQYYEEHPEAAAEVEEAEAAAAEAQDQEAPAPEAPAAEAEPAAEEVPAADDAAEEAPAEPQE